MLDQGEFIVLPFHSHLINSFIIGSMGLEHPWNSPTHIKFHKDHSTVTFHLTRTHTSTCLIEFHWCWVVAGVLFSILLLFNSYSCHRFETFEKLICKVPWADSAKWAYIVLIYVIPVRIESDNSCTHRQTPLRSSSDWADSRFNCSTVYCIN